MCTFKKLVSLCLCLLMLVCMLASCYEETPGIQGEPGVQGEQGEKGDKGEKGEKGEDGVNPTIAISDDGYWVINGTKTYFKATGTDGQNGSDGVTPSITISSDGYWVINNVVSQYKAVGENGLDGNTPTVEISDDGYWVLNGTKTIHKVMGENGQNGTNGITPKLRINEESNEWEVSYDNGETWTSLGVKATGESGANGSNGQNGQNGTNGITPKLRINEVSNEWEVSYDNGETWTSLGVKATGADGSNGNKGDDGATIESISFNDEGKLVITMTNGTEFIVDVPEKEEHVHTYGELVGFGDNASLDCDKRIYFSVCADCHELKWVYGKYADHVFSAEYTSNGMYHWFACEKCKLKGSYEEHTPDKGGFCAVCEQHLSPSEGIVYQIVDDHAEVIDYTGSAEKIMIADIYGGKPVTVISNSAFEGMSIHTVILPNTLHTIGDFAFNDSDLEAIDIPQGVTSIGRYAFANCHDLQSVRLPDSIKEIEIMAFTSESCFSIENGVSYLGKWAVDFDNSVTTVVLREDTVGVAGYAFADSRKIRSMTLPNSLKYIGKQAFFNCSALSQIDIPDSVITIGDSAFSSCDNLSTVKIGSGVTVIGYQAFDYFDGSVYYMGSTAEWESIEKGFFNFDEATVYYYSDNEPDDVGHYWHYVEGIPTVWPNLAYVYFYNGDQLLETQEILKNSSATLPQTIPTKADDNGLRYTFSHWSDEENGSAYDFSETVAKRVTLYAVYTREEIDYEVRYYNTKGVDNSNITQYTVSTACELQDLFKEHYIFDGWYTADGGQVHSIAAGTTGDLSLYARWTPVEYSITYVSQYPDCQNANPKTYTVESDFVLQDGVLDAYHSFAGWYIDEEFTIPFNQITPHNSGNITLYANWEFSGTYISTADEFLTIVYDMSGTYELTADIEIDFTVGDETNPFTGYFRGNGHTITATGNVFGDVSGEIYDVKTNMQLCNKHTGIIKYCTAAQICEVNSGEIYRCTSTERGITSRNLSEGLIAQCTSYGYSSYSWITGEYIPDEWYLKPVNKKTTMCYGGIAAVNQGAVTECVVECDMCFLASANKTIELYVYAGGIAGDNSNGTISDCRFDGYVDFIAEHASSFTDYTYIGNTDVRCYTYGGGIAGYGGTVSDCYFRGYVYGEANTAHYAKGGSYYPDTVIYGCSYVYIGGIVGADGSVSNSIFIFDKYCYETLSDLAVESVSTGTYDTEVWAGMISASGGSVSNSYYCGAQINSSAGSGKINLNGIASSEHNFKSATYISTNLGWNEERWVLKNGSYPYLCWESIAN